MNFDVKKLTYIRDRNMDAERFVARDTKSALEKVRERLGADALILSTERSDSGIEISAISGESFEQRANQPAMTSSLESANEITLGYLDRELKALREVLYSALGERSWQEAVGKAPVSSTVEQRLHTLGLSKPAIEEVTSNIDFHEGLNSSWSAVLANLVSAITLATESASSLSMVPKAVIGGSNGCRSLTCQQLIKKSLHEGLKPSEILVVSFTPDPSGALVNFCKREGIKRTGVASGSELRRCLRRVVGRKKVIIETADLAPSLGVNDPILELFADPALGVQGILVAPAIHQSEILRSINQHIKNLPIIGTIISLTSEAVSLGGVLDTLILGELPLIGITQQPDGAIQRVTAGGLINCAKRLARERSEERSVVSGMSSTSRTA